MAEPTRAWPLPHTGMHSVQLVATATATRGFRKKPSPLAPQCAARSTSMWPTPSYLRSAQVRIGMHFFSAETESVVVTGRRPPPPRNGASNRSIVAALRFTSCSRNSAVRVTALHPSSIGTSSAKKGASRFGHTRSVASHATRKASTSSRPYTLGRPPRLALAMRVAQQANRRLAVIALQSADFLQKTPYLAFVGLQVVPTHRRSYFMHTR